MKVSTFGRDSEPSTVGFTEETLFKVYRALRRCDLSEEQAMACVNEMQNEGILFRERVPDPSDIVPWKHKPGYRIRDARPKAIRLQCPYCDHRALGPSDMYGKVADDWCKHIFDNHPDDSHKPVTLLCPYCQRHAWGENFSEANRVLNSHINANHGEGI